MNDETRTSTEAAGTANHAHAPNSGKYAIDLSGAQWRISSHSSGSGSCVELAALEAGHVAVRDSTDRSRPALVFDAAEWQAFVAGMADGQFGDLG
ncbi:MAG TPA: DUF397 domain-containing protein [Actinocrinis sp.]|nr:DUF397 domain-containing protein [Actinocrinis sp.]